MTAVWMQVYKTKKDNTPGLHCGTMYADKQRDDMSTPKPEEKWNWKLREIARRGKISESWFPASFCLSQEGGAAG